MKQDPSDPDGGSEGPKSARRSHASRWVLAAILLLAFVLRAWNLDWDRGTHLQPDERFWSDVAANVERPDDFDLGLVLDPERSPLNPRVYKDTYVYGTLPLWASEAAAGILMTDTMAPVVSALDTLGINTLRDEPADAPVRERLRFNTGFDVTLIGRLMSALVDTATVAAVYLLARELGDRKTGLLAALLQALTVLHIQYSHFLGSEPWVAFFVTCTVFGSVRLARGRGGWKTRAFTAVALGLAIASKLNGIAAAVAPVVAALVVIGPDLRGLISARIEPGVVGRVARRVEPYLVMALLAVVAYRIAQPYDFQAGISLAFNHRFESDIEYLSDINSGGNWPWVQPLVGRSPLIHPLKQMFLWGMGPGLGLAAIFGLGRAVRRFFAGERYWAVPLAVVLAYWVLVSQQFYAIVRYLQPSYPIVTSLAAVGLVAAVRWSRTIADVRPQLSRAVKVAVGLCVGATVFWALAFVNGVYNNDNARLAAGDWMIENLPPDVVVSQQEWDDGVPWGVASTFGRETLRPFSFGGDSPEGIELLIQGLDNVDYVIETSNKFYDALPRTPARFPRVTEYYERLFDGSLGFELVQTFQNQPSLFGITIDDSDAEEAFTLYDHPTVFMWKKTDRFSVDRAYELLNPDRARVTINADPKDAYANGGMLTPDQYRTQQSGSSFADVHSNDPPSLVAAVLWFAVIQLVALAIAPLVLRTAGSAAGALYGLTKPLALLVLAMPIWVVVSLGWFDFSRALVLVTLLVILGAGAAFFRSSADELRILWQRHRRVILASEAVFAAVFLAVVALRAGNPDLWHPWRGGEKPMELSYFTAITGSTTLPPYDPWLAGGSLNYYYLGWFLLAVPTRLLGFMPDVAFNLGVATYAALAAISVFSTGATLAVLLSRRQTQRIPTAGAGGLAVVMFLVMGNLDSFRQVVSRFRNGQPLSEFDWWDPSRVNKNSSGFEVTEFPSFTVLFADLHPHFMAMTFFGLGLAAAVALVHRTRQGNMAASWVLAIGLGLGSGIIRMVHTWDLPTFVIFSGAAAVIGWWLAEGPAGWRARSAVAQLVAMGLAHLLITAPYRAHNQVADSGFHRAESSTNLDDWIAHWGFFLFVAIAYAAVALQRRRAELVDEQLGSLLSALAIAVGGFAIFHVSVGSVAAWSFVGVTVAALLVALELRSSRASTPLVFVSAAWMLGFAVLVGVETYTQNADIERLNTVFKFWLQVWHLFAIAGAVSVMWIVAPMWTFAVDRTESPLQRLEAISRRRRVFAGGVVALLVVSLLYPALAIRPRQASRFDTTLGMSLDGQQWLEPGRHTVAVLGYDGREHVVDPGEDRSIINWLQQNAVGRPTVVEAVGGGHYQWWGRIAVNTGLPAVVGWRWHQTQQRTLFAYEVDERNREVGEFYSLGDQAQIDAFLRAYDVTYIVVGTLENAVADPRTLELFTQNPSLTPVFLDGTSVIYEVEGSALVRSYLPDLALDS